MSHAESFNTRDLPQPAPAAPLAVLPAREDQKVALNYGKNPDASWLPTKQSLLRQLEKDDAPKLSALNAEAAAKPDDHSRFSPTVRLKDLTRAMDAETKAINSLSDADLKNVGDFAQALHNDDWKKAEEVIKRYHDNPLQLEQFYKPLQLELEAANMTNEYNLSSANIGPSGSQLEVQRLDPKTGEYTNLKFSTNDTTL